jgi:hypothetical protein
MPTPITTIRSTHDAETPALKSALEERRPFLLAMPEEDIERQPKVDASVAAEAVIGCAPQIASQRAALVARFGAEAGTLVDELLTVARATKQADVELTAAAASGDLSGLETELRAEHALLLTDGQSLANRKLLDPQRLEPARSTLGYRTLIHNTLVLVSLLREQWGDIKDFTPIKEADLERAEAKALHMLTVLGEREAGTTRVPAAELRFRALSALVHHYDEIRRMVSFVRWHEGDADEIAPSLYVRRPGRRARDGEPDGSTTTDGPVVTAASPTSAVQTGVNGVSPSPFVA